MMASPGSRRGWAFIVPVVLGLLAAGLVPAGDALAQSDPSWRVMNRLEGKVKNGAAGKAEDVSGIACAPGPAYPRLCLVVDDESQGAQIVILTNGMLIAGESIRLIHDAYKGKPLELDAEGVAYADGFFYVIGSHGRARHEDDVAKQAKNDAKAAATRQIFRIALSADAVDFDSGLLKSDPVITASPGLAALLEADPVLAPFFDRALEDNGLTIEGVAVRGDKVYAALRGPIVDPGSAVIVSAPLAKVFEGQPGEMELHRLILGVDTLGRARGIRDLTVDGDGFLLIAGPENDPPKDHDIAPGDYAVYAWDGGDARKVLDLNPYGKKAKPEALLPLDQKGGTLRALLMFDGPKEGLPTPVEIPLQ